MDGICISCCATLRRGRDSHAQLIIVGGAREELWFRPREDGGGIEGGRGALGIQIVGRFSMVYLHGCVAGGGASGPLQSNCR